MMNDPPFTLKELLRLSGTKPIVWVSDEPDRGVSIDWIALDAGDVTPGDVLLISGKSLSPKVVEQTWKKGAAGNYVNSIMAKTLAHRFGFDDAIMLDPEGYVAEGSGMNIFVVRDEVIYTPPRTTILGGITRDSVITLARDLGYAVVEERLVRDQLYIADEVFVSGTAAEVVAVSEIDTRKIGTGKMGLGNAPHPASFLDALASVALLVGQHFSNGQAGGVAGG